MTALVTDDPSTASAQPTPAFAPAPHDSRERVVVDRWRGWAVLQFPEDDRRRTYFAARGLLHLQLWYPERGVSVLTPSRLTAGLYEVMLVPHAACGRTDDADALALALECEVGVRFPPTARLKAWVDWHVQRHCRAAELCVGRAP